MRAWTKVWIVVAAICVGLTVYEIPNAVRIWRYARTAISEKREFGKKTLPESVLTEEIAAVDPEAADILTYCLTDPNDEELAELVAKYPDNEFFLAQLAYKLTDVNLVDARVVPALADRLIALDRDNAHYWFMKGWMLLRRPWGVGREQEALEQFKQGNDLPDFNLPYSRYKQRVDGLCEKARMGLLDRRRAAPSETGIYWELIKFISRAHGVYPKLDEESFRHLSAAVAQAAVRLISNARHDGHLEHGTMLLLSCEGARLRQLDLSEAEAQQARFRLSQSLDIRDILGDYMIAMFGVLADLMKIALVVGVGAVLFLPLPFPLVWVFVVIVNWLRGRAPHVVVGIKAYALFVVGLAGSVGLAALMALLNRGLGGRFLGGLAFAVAAIGAWALLWLSARIPPVDRACFQNSRRRAAIVCAGFWPLGLALDIIVCAFVLDASAVTKWLVFAGGLLGWSLLCAAIGGLMTYKHHVFRAIPYDRVSRNRLVQLALVLLLMTGMTGLLRPVPVVPWILAFFTILLVGLVATHVSESRLICFDAIRDFFRKEGQIVVTRTKMARIMSTILLLCWVTILVGIHLSADKWSRLDTLLTDPLSLCRPLPQATRETYERVLSKKYSADPNAPVRSRFMEDAGLPEELHLASPEDLLAIIRDRQAAGNPIREELLLNVMARGGHDIRRIVVKTLKDPNALDVLITRAKWGDASVKEQLEQIFEEKMAGLAQTIAPIREDPNSAESLIIRLRWGDDTVEEKLEHALEAKMTELSERVPDAENRNELRSELTKLLEMDSALGGSSPQAFDPYEYAMMMEQEYGLASPFGARDPNAQKRLHKGRERSSRVRQLVIDANMQELLERRARHDLRGPDLFESLLRMAGALAFVSDPGEAEARFSRLLDLVAERRLDEDSADSRRASNMLLELWAGASNKWDQGQECLFFRALTGVPGPNVTALLKDYLQRLRLADPFDQTEFLDVFYRAGDRELAEWVFQKVAESPPAAEVSHFPDGIPIGRPVRVSEVRQEKRREDISHEYLEAVFPHLTAESIPLLLEHLDSDNDQLRAFIVWRVTSLGYKWPRERLAALRRDSFWKVRLNVLFALDADDLATALDDENPVVRIVAQMLNHNRKSES